MLTEVVLVKNNSIAVFLPVPTRFLERHFRAPQLVTSWFNNAQSLVEDKDNLSSPIGLQKN